MDELATALIYVLGAGAAVVVGLLVGKFCLIALVYGLDLLIGACYRIWDSADAAGYRIGRRARRRELVGWLNAKVGASRPFASTDRRILRARRQTPIIRKLVQEEIPETIGRCLKLHRMMAFAAGAEFISEIGDEPDCLLMRERVVDLIEIAVEMLGGYPLLLDDAALMQNAVVLRKRILPTCQACPYLGYAVDRAPPLCPSAQMAQIPQEKCASHERQTQV